MNALADWIYPPEHDAIVARAIGLILSGCLILAWAGLRVLDQIGDLP